ncbi:hypothetical protein M569_02326, partial [Genlisea aurea]
MAKRIQSFFLEEWLRNSIISSSKKNDSVIASSPSSAQTIIKAWAELREVLLHQSFLTHHLEALKLLVNFQASIYVADPQARILLLILSSDKISLPQESYPLFIRLLYVWVRKSRQNSELVDSAIDIIARLLSQRTSYEGSSVLLCDGVLLLGALSFQTPASDQSKSLCYELISKLLEEEHGLIFMSDELATNALAGISYALSSSMPIYFKRILGILFRDLCYCIQWSGLSVNRSGSSGFMDLKNSAEEHIDIVARTLFFQTRDSDYVATSNIPLQCFALALARSGSISFRAPLLLSLAFALLVEVFPLKRLYNKVLYAPGENLMSTVYEEVEHHLNGVIFKEAGSITGVCCNLYALADEGTRDSVEEQIWTYCQEVYSWHRQARLILAGTGDELNGKIEKIVESAFLMVVVFALGVTKHRLDAGVNLESKSEISVRILISFSCMEYFRRVRLSEYMDTIRAVIVYVQENTSSCSAFVKSLPSYDDLVFHRGSSRFNGYIWSGDDVQTARVLFYMRVVSTFLDKLPSSVFKAAVAPTMFLYMGHPNAKVARYAHTVFAAFVSSGKDYSSQDEERALLKEQLGYHYLKRSLESYPGITPFEGLASGVSAMVRCLPAGSPTLFYCVHSLVEKARSLPVETDPFKKAFDLLLRLLSLTDVQVLPSLMKLMAELIVQLPVPCRNTVLNQLYRQIAESDDVVRKPSLVSWVQSLSYLCSCGAR